MFYNDALRQDDVDINITNQNVNTNTNDNMNYNMMGGYEQMPMQAPIMQAPIIEPGRERIINRTFVHEVPHVCPINTRIINNHIYRHTYQPRYTCCEENRVCQEQCGSCCQFQ